MRFPWDDASECDPSRIAPRIRHLRGRDTPSSRKAAAGDPEIKSKLLQGYSADDNAMNKSRGGLTPALQTSSTVATMR